MLSVKGHEKEASLMVQGLAIGLQGLVCHGTPSCSAPGRIVVLYQRSWTHGTNPPIDPTAMAVNVRARFCESDSDLPGTLRYEATVNHSLFCVALEEHNQFIST